MNNAKIITILGASGSGKSNIAFKIAKELENNDNKVCIVSFDSISPLATITNDYEKYNISIGDLLTNDTHLSQREILSSMIMLTDNISLITYVYGDTKDKYPKIVIHKVRSFFDLLSGIVDYIIVDGCSNVIEPEIRTACLVSNKIINIIEPTYKSLSYYKTFNMLLERINIDNNKIVYLINKIDYDTEYKKYLLDMGIKYYYELPFVKEIITKENTPFLQLEKKSHEAEKYKRKFKELIRGVYDIKYDSEEFKEEIKVNIKVNNDKISKNYINEEESDKKSKGFLGLFKKDKSKDKETKKGSKNYYINEGEY